LLHFTGVPGGADSFHLSTARRGALRWKGRRRFFSSLHRAPRSTAPETQAPILFISPPRAEEHSDGVTVAELARVRVSASLPEVPAPSSGSATSRMVRNFVALPETSLLLSMSNENESQLVFQQTVATFEYFIAPKRKGLGKDCFTARFP
jgi:hypothetical protein